MDAWKQVYKKWDTFPNLEQTLREELNALKLDTAELKDAFRKELTYKKDGIRGQLGPGTNRMNIYMVRKVVNGLANYLLENAVNVKDRGVVIAFDSNHKSKEFAEETAKVLGYFGIRTYIFNVVRPTPLLSFAVKYRSTAAGIMITASQSPLMFHSLKIYNEEGVQLPLTEIDRFVSFINKVENELTVPYLDKTDLEKSQLLFELGSEVDDAYLERLKYISRMDEETKREKKELRFVLQGQGTELSLISKGLEGFGFTDLHLVKNQAKTEIGLDEAVELGGSVDADILLATDPNAEKLKVAVKNEDGKYETLTGNQLGSLLLDYILRNSESNIYQNPRVIKTVVTTELSRAIADSFYVKMMDSLPSFKYIGEKIHRYVASGKSFLFGLDENNQYAISGFVPDKDGTQAAVMTAEMAYYWKRQGKSLWDVLEELYEKHGYYLEHMISIENKEGTKGMQRVSEYFQDQTITKIAGLKVLQIDNYITSKRKWIDNDLVEEMHEPKENIIKLHLEKNAWIAICTSDIEPKMTCYYGVWDWEKQVSETLLIELEKGIRQLMDDMLLTYA